MHERLEAIVSGRVQRVMFRDFSQRKAKGLELIGTVRNLGNGTVHVIAEGARENLETYLDKLGKGPLLANVERVQPEWKEATGEFNSFVILYD